MSESFPKSAGFRRPRGFTLVELMVGMALALIVLALAFNFLDQLYNTTDLVGAMGDVNENLRAAVNVISRDLSTCGWAIPSGGIPIPSGGTATSILMPGPPLNSLSPANTSANNFPANGGYMAVLTPGPGYGQQTCPHALLASCPTGTPTFTWSGLETGGTPTPIPTDQITMISVNPLITPIAITGAPTISVTAATVTTATSPSQILPGQLIMLQNTNGACLLTATATTTTSITFTKGDAADVLGLNQFNGPTSGTINQLETPCSPTPCPPPSPTWPAISASAINMVTYYVDNSSPQRLMRLVGSGCTNPPVATCSSGGGPQPVALGINVLQFSYSFSPLATPTDPIRGPFTSPNQIRKVNVWVIAQADHPNRKSGLYYTNSIATSVAIQNLAYSNQFQ